MASQRLLTYRIEGIPTHMSKAELKGLFHSDDKQYVEVKSLVPDVLNFDGNGRQTATILFTHPEQCTPRMDDTDQGITLDKDFIGFTPLNKAVIEAAADIIAITGLAGHAFGSWAHSPRKMWLRDYLPTDIQNRARILIYGYNSQLQGANAAKNILSDFGTAFIDSLLTIRDHPSFRDRPLILIGHSLGALIIKQAIADLNPAIRSRLPVRAVLFFGAPHNGLHTTALETLVKGKPTETLIGELRHDSPTLDGLANRFSHVADNIGIHSYYESRPTNTVILTPGQEWRRDGPPQVMVEKSSAVLNYRQEETRMSVDGNHKEIARLRPGQGGAYPNVLRVIKVALEGASQQFTAAIRGKVERQISVESTTNDSFKQVDNDDSSVSILLCDECYDEIPKHKVHFHCTICEGGDFNLCLPCRKRGMGCPDQHKLSKRQLTSSITKRKTDGLDQATPKEITKGTSRNTTTDSQKTQSCETSGSESELPKVQKNKSTNKSGNGKLSAEVKAKAPVGIVKSTQNKQYCEIAGCNCALPKRPKKNSKNSRTTTVAEKKNSYDEQDTFGMTPLMWAVQGSDEMKVQKLLDGGADINATDIHKRTPLICAAERKKEEMVKLLLEKGANVSATNPFGDTALDLAKNAKSEAIVRLLEKPTNMNVKKTAQSPKEDVEAPNQHGLTRLHWASISGQQNEVQSLLDKGANIDARTDGGMTALHFATCHGHQAIVNLLVKKGADPNIKTNADLTPLDMAQRDGNKQAEETLREAIKQDDTSSNESDKDECEDESEDDDVDGSFDSDAETYVAPSTPSYVAHSTPSYVPPYIPPYMMPYSGY